MRATLHLIACALSLLLAALWLFAFEHKVVCHCGQDEDEHGCAESLACSCVCHAAVEAASEPELPARRPAIASVPQSDETLCLPLLPADIFRPPLAVLS